VLSNFIEAFVVLLSDFVLGLELVNHVIKQVNVNFEGLLVINII
jgi:hypothetical protein